MSNIINDSLMERANYVMGQYTGTMLETAIAFNIEQNDLQKVEFLVTQAEYELGMEDIHGEGLSCDTY